jgi:hypothetical protein
MNEKPFLTKLLIAALTIAASVWLVHWAAHLLMEVWWVLAIVAILVILGLFAYRLWRNRRW